MKETVLQIAATLVLVITGLGQEQSAPVKTSTGVIPSDHAKAIFDDERVKNLINVAKDSFGVTCNLPDVNKVTATITQRGPVPGVPDSVNFVYDFPITCSGDSKMNINAQFAPPLGTPLDMTVTTKLHSTK